MDNKEIGNKIRKYREENNWAQYRLALESGVAASYIPELESGKKCPTVQTLENICYAFGITLAEFFAEEGEKEPQEQIAGLTVAESKLIYYYRSLPAAKRQALITLIEKNK